MKRFWNRSLAAGCCAALLLSVVLAGCRDSSSSSSSSVSSQTLSEAPTSQTVPSGQEDTTPAPKPTVDGGENGFNAISDPAGAFAGCLGWGPGTAGTSLKSMAAAASMMDWAEENRVSDRSSDALHDTLTQWFDSLEQADQENFAEAWPLIEESAQRILGDSNAIQQEMLDAGVQEAPSCSDADWSALASALDAIVPAPQQ